MRGSTVGAVLCMALLMPKVGNAQPTVTAQSADWQISSQPIVVDGLVYYPTRETRFFDKEIMTQTGVYLGVPVYADVTLEPYSVLYVPLSRMMMRGYERRRDGELAGTTGSRVPSFPVDIRTDAESEARTFTIPGAAGTGGTLPAPGASVFTPDVPRVTRTRMESIPRPRGNDGIWVEYAGERWYSDGPAVVFDAQRFHQIGVYRGFPVYRDAERGAEEIWVRVVADGPVAPYTKR